MNGSRCNVASIDDPRTLTTLLYLLRGFAQQQRRMHGPLVERPGGIELTPREMEALADDLEAGIVTLAQDELLS